MKRILLIEDDESLRKLLRMSLEGAGYAVTEAPDGKVGLGLLAKAPADLVITDLVMPGKEGLETILEMRRSRPHQKIIAMSGGSRMGTKDNLTMAKNFGASLVFLKPFSLAEIIAGVSSLLGAPHEDAGERVVEPE
jgi:DNA-binding response OmpR family regulator